VQLALVRHGEPQRGSADRKDPPLSALGRSQSERVADYLAGEHFDALYTSPLRRARETAGFIGSVLGLEPHPLEELAEFDRAAAEYLHFEDLRAADDPRYAAVLAGDLSAWGTTLEKFRAGFENAFAELYARHPDGSVLAVTHGGVLNGYLGARLGTASFFFFRPEYTGINRLEFMGPDESRVVSLNECPHLRPVRQAVGSDVTTADPRPWPPT
jgi:broad specificity phosphatase PhoE